MLREIHCEGAPRDLGFDQGRAFAGALRARFGDQSLADRWRQRLGARTPATVALVRDLVRHYPQQSEALEGMVSGARVPYLWLAEQLARELSPRDGSLPALASGDGAGCGALVARALPEPPCVRHSRPEGGFASVELTAPWYAASFAGVNSGGLAVAGLPLPGKATTSACAVSGAAMVQDCLARFDSVRGAVDWCNGRPAGGRAVILMADASGAVAAVAIDGDRRRALPPKDGLIEVDAAAASQEFRTATPEARSAPLARLGGIAAAIDPVRRCIDVHDRDAGRSWRFTLDAADRGD